MKQIRFLFCGLLAAGTMLQPVQARSEYPGYYGGFGSADYCQEKTVIVSIFADDVNCSWNFNDDDDYREYSTAYFALQKGVEWVEDQIHNRNGSASIVWDWYNNDYMYYEAHFDEEMLSGNGNTWQLCNEFIEQNIDCEWITNMYCADNIVFNFYFDGEGQDDTWAYCYPCWGVVPDDSYRYEFAVFNCGHTYDPTPAVYAHELLHLFGAPDYYYGSEYIPQSYADYMQDIGATEIMFGYEGVNYDYVDAYFSDLTAYYIGLCEAPWEFYEFTLRESLFDQIS